MTSVSSRLSTRETSVMTLVLKSTGSSVDSSIPLRPKLLFTVAPPDIPPAAPVEPTAAPAMPPDGTIPVCTVCPDGTSVLNPLAQADEFDMSCANLETLASNRNITKCRAIQDSSAFDCGCTNFCTTICPDRISEPPPESGDTIVLARNTDQVTCSDLQREIASGTKNSLEECLSAQFLGEDVHGCEPTDRFCRICQNGVVPPADALEMEIIAGLNCRDITAIAYTLRAADPSGIFFRLCPACLAIGAYSKCEQPTPANGGREFCRLCGDNDDLLPEPSRIVDSMTLQQTTTCFHVELASNINDPETLECAAYRQDAEAACCA